MNKSKQLLLFTTLILSLALSSCSLKLIDDYDQELANEIIRVAKEVDKFFIDIYDYQPTERTYENFAQRYRELEAELTMLVLANRIRPLNEESIMIAENTLEQWQNLKRFHKESDELASLPENHPDHISKEEIFSNVMIEDSRKNFLDSFSAMAAAEYAKEYAIN